MDSMKKSRRIMADDIQIIHGDCLEVMAGMPDDSVDLIATDPPYFKVKPDWWDRQWSGVDSFIEWIGQLCEQWQRILRPNGSLYCFASPQMAARVECEIGRRFSIVNRITWAKPRFATKAEMFRKDDLRGFFTSSEAIIFAEHFNADNIAKGEAGYLRKCDELRGFVFEPLRAYLDGERKRAGVDKADCNVALGLACGGGGMASHYFGKTLQWALPTEEHYAAMRQLFNNGSIKYLRREYEELRREYEELRRPFYATPDAPYTDVWDFPTVGHYKGKHPCEKPLAMIEHIVTVSSRPGAVVLDCFAGSGVTGIAAVKHGRRFIGIEIEQQWIDRIQARIGGIPTVAIVPRGTKRVDIHPTDPMLWDEAG